MTRDCGNFHFGEIFALRLPCIIFRHEIDDCGENMKWQYKILLILAEICMPAGKYSIQGRISADFIRVGNQLL